jgi:hypothetical protein
MPHIDLLLEEMSELRIVNDRKVDHPRKGSKDLSDAVTGAVYNAISLTPRNLNQEVEIHDWKSLAKEHERVEVSTAIVAPPKMTMDIEAYLDSFGLL